MITLNGKTISDEALSDAVNSLSERESGSLLSYRDVEKAVGVKLYPGQVFEDNKSSREWRGYTHQRSQLVKVINGAAEGLGKAECFLLTPDVEAESGENCLMLRRKNSAGKYMVDFTRKSTTRAPQRGIEQLDRIMENFALAPKTKKDLKNAQHAFALISSATAKMFGAIERRGSLPNSTAARLMREAVDENEEE